jgi:molecular chaperone GrpE
MQRTNTQSENRVEDVVALEDVFGPGTSEMEELLEEVASERNERLRLAAEFDNFRRRVRGVRDEASEEGKRYVLAQLLPICDDLDLATAHSDAEAGPVQQGLAVIRRRLDQVLESNGVVRFESEGEIFDPERHEAFDVIEAADGMEGRVHKEVRAGYLWKDKLLRAALVVVSQ